MPHNLLYYVNCLKNHFFFIFINIVQSMQMRSLTTAVHVLDIQYIVNSVYMYGKWSTRKRDWTLKTGVEWPKQKKKKVMRYITITLSKSEKWWVGRNSCIEAAVYWLVEPRGLSIYKKRWVIEWVDLRIVWFSATCSFGIAFEPVQVLQLLHLFS